MVWRRGKTVMLEKNRIDSVSLLCIICHWQELIRRFRSCWSISLIDLDLNNNTHARADTHTHTHVATASSLAISYWSVTAWRQCNEMDTTQACAVPRLITSTALRTNAVDIDGYTGLLACHSFHNVVDRPKCKAAGRPVSQPLNYTRDVFKSFREPSRESNRRHCSTEEEVTSLQV